MRKLFKRIFDVLNSVAILALLIAYLAPFVDPIDFWPIAFFGLTYKIWALLNLVLLVIWIILKRRRWVYNAFFLLIGFQFIARNIQFNKPTNTKSDFKICTFNTNVQQVYNEGNTSPEINKYLSENNYDVAVLIEWLDKKGSISFKHYPNQQFLKLKAKKNKYDYGLRLVSKHKIINYEQIKYDQISSNMAAYFDIEIEGEIVRFFSIHLQSNGVSSKDYHTLVNVEIDEEYKEYALNFANTLRAQIQHRSEQTKTILKAINESPYPVVIMGDFNDTPQSYTYQELKEGRKDAFIETGNGWGATFLKPFPLLRIDYILHDNELKCSSYKSLTPIKSDHALVEATFSLKN